MQRSLALILGGMLALAARAGLAAPEPALPENHDLQLVATEHFNPTDLSVAAQFTRLKQSNPQVLLAGRPAPRSGPSTPS